MLDFLHNAIGLCEVSAQYPASMLKDGSGHPAAWTLNHAAYFFKYSLRKNWPKAAALNDRIQNCGRPAV
jgi:hypothetical protein